MPVLRFRDVSEMDDTLWREPGPELFRTIAAVWGFAERVCRRRFPPGVYKHRSIEEAERQRDAWDEQNFREYWDRQAKSAQR